MSDNEQKMTMHQRNTQSVEMKIRELDDMIREQNKKINLLTDTISTLYNRMNELEQRMNIQKIQMVGTGPSVRE